MICREAHCNVYLFPKFNKLKCLTHTNTDRHPPTEALLLMVNDSSFSFDLTRKSYSMGFYLSITVVILVWETELAVKCVGVHVSYHV